MPLTTGDLTPIQSRIRQYIEDFALDAGHAPSYREIGRAVGLASLSSVSLHVHTLQRKGYLIREAGRPRTAVVRAGDPVPVPRAPGAAGEADVHPGHPGHPGLRNAAYVPLAGQIGAGEGILSGQEVLPTDSAQDAFVLPRELVGEGTLFMLRVSGQSMIGAGITDGDLVVIRQQEDAENGDIVAALIDGGQVEGTVKTLKRSGGHTWLMPQNPAYTPILGDSATIVGKLVAVLRRV
ncbi:MAG TPA: transcriptional repressor LexA [Streptosporangiaceae bacterium]|nr:transcriptional repressor LexA [Streptosporangiaceae bacterium]